MLCSSGAVDVKKETDTESKDYGGLIMRVLPQKGTPV
jgi:hypothetical protein